MNVRFLATWNERPHVSVVLLLLFGGNILCNEVLRYMGRESNGAVFGTVAIPLNDEFSLQPKPTCRAILSTVYSRERF